MNVKNANILSLYNRKLPLYRECVFDNLGTYNNGLIKIKRLFAMQVIKIKREKLQTDFYRSLETDEDGINILRAIQDAPVSENDLVGMYVCVGNTLHSWISD